MSLILVVETEARHAERVRDGLGSDGWQVEVVASCEEAVASAAARAPQLVLANVEVPGAIDLLRNFSRARGGPGSIALLPELAGIDAGATPADESLAKPFTDKDLRLLARRLASAARPARHADESDDQKRLTSHELFGDLLAEVESEAAGLELGAAAAQPLAPPPPAPAPAPLPTPPPAHAPRATAADREIGQKLEQTLSGMLKEDKPRAATPKKPAAVDDLLTRTLSGLEVGKKTAAPKAPEKPAPAAAPPRATPPPAPSPAAAGPPVAAGRPAPRPAEAPPAPAPPASAPPVAPARAPERPKAKPSEPAARRPSREIDFASLDELAKPRARETAPPAKSPTKESFATQKISIPPSVGKPASNEFGQYTLLERIAVGGMAEVWKARMKGMEGFQKTVAIKKILPHLTDSSDFVTMFIDEAKLAAQLNHNNIIHIYDLGKLGDDYFIAMEYVDGRDLRTILNTARAESRPLPMNLSLLIASRLASALDYAHRKRDFEDRELGLVHRDVSPQNVLISFEGDIKLCDFGIVKAVTKASKTQMGALKGKLQYMSPEQAWGRPVDARSDIFSLGSLLFEMLTGRRLFSGESEISVLDAVREGRITAPRDLDPRLPLEVNALVLKALARDPDDRFETAGEMQREIDGILSSLKPTPTQGDLGDYLKRLFGPEAKAPEAASGAAGVTASSGPSGPAVPAAARPAEVAVVTPAAGARVEESETTRGRGALWGAIAAAAVLGVVGYLVFGRGASSPPPPASSPAPVAGEPSPAPQPAAAPAQPAAGTNGAASTAAAPPAAPNVEQLVNDEVRRREEELRKKYEEEIKNRQAELEKLNADKASAATPPASAAEEQRPPAEAATPAPAGAAPTPVATTPAAAPEPTPAEERPVAPPPAEPRPAAPVEEAAPAPRAPLVKEGDLVQPGAGVKPPVLVSLTKPEYPPMARRLKVEGTVILSLLVDETGRVIDTRFDRTVAQNVGINEAALAAARSARFEPATKHGVRVKMWYQLKIPFKL